MTQSAEIEMPQSIDIGMAQSKESFVASLRKILFNTFPSQRFCSWAAQGGHQGPLFVRRNRRDTQNEAIPINS